MSEDVIRTVTSFTPAAVDRDALLFQAGRASVRTPRLWKFAVAGLLASQVATLAVMLRPTDERRGLSPPEAFTPLPADDAPSPVPDPQSYIALTRVTDWEKAPSGGGEPRRSSGPPLTVRTFDID